MTAAWVEGGVAVAGPDGPRTFDLGSSWRAFVGAPGLSSYLVAGFHDERRVVVRRVHTGEGRRARSHLEIHVVTDRRWSCPTPSRGPGSRAGRA